MNKYVQLALSHGVTVRRHSKITLASGPKEVETFGRSVHNSAIDKAAELVTALANTPGISPATTANLMVVANSVLLLKE